MNLKQWFGTPSPEMYFEDLTAYTYLHDKGSSRTLNVGWLDLSKSYQKGDVPLGFVERLRRIMLRRYQQTRGFHTCPFCSGPHAANSIGFNMQRYQQCLRDGRLSSAEIRVKGEDSTWYATPQMIAHYVEAHHYVPPQVFIDAVMNVEDLPNG